MFFYFNRTTLDDLNKNFPEKYREYLKIKEHYKDNREKLLEDWYALKMERASFSGMHSHKLKDVLATDMKYFSSESQFYFSILDHLYNNKDTILTPPEKDIVDNITEEIIMSLPDYIERMKGLYYEEGSYDKKKLEEDMIEILNINDRYSQEVSLNNPIIDNKFQLRKHIFLRMEKSLIYISEEDGKNVDELYQELVYHTDKINELSKIIRFK